MVDTDTVYINDFSHPVRNLSSKGMPRNESEAAFADSFSSVYREKFIAIHRGTHKEHALFVREIPVSGYGIADLLVLSWKKTRRKIKKPQDVMNLHPTIRAFEAKLSDWRSGLMQAHRYKYYANVSILVLPTKKAILANKHLNLFKTVRVGLWGFDEKKEVITTYYTPRPKLQTAISNFQKAVTAATQGPLFHAR